MLKTLIKILTDLNNKNKTQKKSLKNLKLKQSLKKYNFKFGKTEKKQKEYTEKFIEMHKNGITVNKIAQHFKTTRITISKMMKKYGYIPQENSIKKRNKIQDKSNNNQDFILKENKALKETINTIFRYAQTYENFYGHNNIVVKILNEIEGRKKEGIIDINFKQPKTLYKFSK